MTWYEQSFENLNQLDVVEFYPTGVDPNLDPTAEPFHGGPVQITSAPHVPGPLDGSSAGLMVRAGSQASRVRSDSYTPWLRAGGYVGQRWR